MPQRLGCEIPKLELAPQSARFFLDLVSSIAIT
jgi:hypothetical protein